MNLSPTIAITLITYHWEIIRRCFFVCLFSLLFSSFFLKKKEILFLYVVGT